MISGLVFGRNLLTGAVMSIPSSPSFDEQSISALQEGLLLNPGEYKLNGVPVGVVVTPNYVFSGLLAWSVLDQEGKYRQVESTLRDLRLYCESLDQFTSEAVEEYVNFSHDIRYLIGTLVHKSVVNKRNENNIVELRQNLKAINEVSSIVSAKDAFFRFQTRTGDDREVDIDVTGKFFKIYKSVSYLGLNHKKSVSFNFESKVTSSIRTLDFFDFIPYLIIENAVKYSMKGQEGQIKIYETGNQIIVEVESMGPMLEPGESARVFERGFRGVNAIKTGIRGEGMGLFQVAEALRILNVGNISIRQRPEIMPPIIDSVPYAWTTVSLTLRKS